MRRVLPLLFLVFAACQAHRYGATNGGIWSPSNTYTDATTVATGGTRTDPTSDNGLGTLGMDITDCTGWRVVISADSGQTLSGAGTVRLWLYDPMVTKRWVHNSQLDYTLSFTSGLFRDDASADFPAFIGIGRVFPQVVGVTSSSGNITSQVVCNAMKVHD